MRHGVLADISSRSSEAVRGPYMPSSFVRPLARAISSSSAITAPTAEPGSCCSTRPRPTSIVAGTGGSQ
jgi:hypothetical protein